MGVHMIPFISVLFPLPPSLPLSLPLSLSPPPNLPLLALAGIQWLSGGHSARSQKRCVERPVLSSRPGQHSHHHPYPHSHPHPQPHPYLLHLLFLNLLQSPFLLLLLLSLSPPPPSPPVCAYGLRGHDSEAVGGQ